MTLGRANSPESPCQTGFEARGLPSQSHGLPPFLACVKIKDVFHPDYAANEGITATCCICSKEDTSARIPAGPRLSLASHMAAPRGPVHMGQLTHTSRYGPIRRQVAYAAMARGVKLVGRQVIWADFCLESPFHRRCIAPCMRSCIDLNGRIVDYLSLQWTVFWCQDAGT